MKRFRKVFGITMPGLLMALLSSAAASPGTARSQEQVPPPQQVVAPHEAILQLGLEVVRLTEQRVLNRGQGVSLTKKLDKARNALTVGDPNAVFRPLNAFDHEVRALVAAQVIDGKNALVLRGLTEQAIVGLNAIRDLPFVGPFITPCPQPDPCKELVLQVDQGAPSGGDGSSGAPFRTIGEALAAAGKAQACRVEIVLHAGTYHESVTLTRATGINGTPGRPVIVGTLFNPAGHALSVSGVTFQGSPAPGAIVVDGPCGSSTEIAGVVIRNAAHYGIFQRRGALRVVGIEVRGTIPDAGDAGTGRAIRLADGVQAVIGFANLSFNVGGGLLASGENTRVYLALSEVFSNDVHPLLALASSRNGNGIIEVTDRALLLTEFTSVVGNRGSGLLAHGGARAHLRYGRIEHSRSVSIEGEGSFYGINALALDGGTVRLSHFRSNHAEFVGLFALGGYARASHGTLGYNDIGMGAWGLPGDFSVDELFACLEEVRFLHNESQFRGDTLPVPCDEEVPASCPACTVTVPFVCTWCV